MNESTIQGKWKELKGKIRQEWGKLTDSEIDEAKGNLTQIAGLIQEKYGTAKEEVSRRLKEMFPPDDNTAIQNDIKIAEEKERRRSA